MRRLPGFVRRLLVTGTGAGLTRAAGTVIARSAAAPGLERVNHDGTTVSLTEGPAVAIGASAAAALGATTPPHRAAALVAGLGSGAVGLYDDTADIAHPDEAKGLTGHLRVLAAGRATSGTAKLVGLGAVGLAAAALIDTGRVDRPRSAPRRLASTLLGAGVIAGTANLVNLFDLRPGRALKLVTSVSGPLSNRGDSCGGIAAGTLGAAGAVMHDDLSERTMLGDCGANSLGALVGLSLTARSGTAARAVLLGAITTLTLASEKVSFTKVIAHTPVLRDVDEFGRRSRLPCGARRRPRIPAHDGV
ncbi:MAG: hypothetical protein ACRD0P_17495 [Stackebrandtia sp.]